MDYFPDIMGVFSALLEILVLAGLFYYTLRTFQGTRGAAVLAGFGILFSALIVLTRVLELDVLNWVVKKALVYMAIALVVIFQPEIRRALAQLGRQSFSGTGEVAMDEVADSLVQAIGVLSDQKIGALIALEREIKTGAIQQTGVSLDAEVSSELLATIFFPRTPLHDGGVIVSGGRIRAAGCLFPLSQREEISRSLGTRHRAAIGITEETDALVLVVSEETGVVSVAYNGRLRRGLDGDRLRRIILSVMRRRKQGAKRLVKVSGDESGLFE